MDLYTSLNDKQLEAVKHDKGPLLILAGAGSGKTRVITHRIAHLISECNVDPWNILAVTFTNKAAGEMRERVENIVGDGGEHIWVATFHSTCVRILRRFIESIGYSRNFTIYDTDDQKTLVKSVVKQLDYDSKMFAERKVLSVISSCKNELKTPEQYKKEDVYDIYTERIYNIYREYQNQLKKNNALDFDDLIMKTVELFTVDSFALDYYRRRFRYILVDEYQDTNTAQFELLHLMTPTINDDGTVENNICVVGDDDQSIYKFRGANIYNILNFEKVYAGTKVIKLEENYRSTSNILDAANEVISNNTMRKQKELWCKKGKGDPITFVRYTSDMDEAAGIVSDIKTNMRSGTYDRYSDYAVLYRTNAQSRIIEENLIYNNIPYKIVGGINFYSRKEIKDILAYFKTIDNGNDDVAVKRIINIPKRGIGLTTINRISDYAAMHDISFYDALKDASYVDGVNAGTVSKINSFVALIEKYRDNLNNADYSLTSLLDDILEDTGYVKELEDEGTDEAKTRLENIEEFKSKIVTFTEANDSDDFLVSGSSDGYDSDPSGTILSSFLENVALVADIDTIDDEADVVLLMTLHSAKGLEFPNVYICGMEENIFPSGIALSGLDDSELEEERRLCYVGITRAKDNLTLSCAFKRMRNGEIQINKPSRFLSEIPRYLISEKHPSGSSGFDDYKRSGSRDSSGYYGNFGSRSNRSSYSSESIFGNDYNDISYKPIGNKKTSGLFTNNPYISKGASKKTDSSSAIDYTVGDSVKHIKFGIGKVTEMTPDGNDHLVTVEFEKFGQRKLKASFAKLKKL